MSKRILILLMFGCRLGRTFIHQTHFEFTQRGIFIYCGFLNVCNILTAKCEKSNYTNDQKEREAYLELHVHTRNQVSEWTILTGIIAAMYNEGYKFSGAGHTYVFVNNLVYK